MVILYAENFELGQIIQIDTSIKRDYFNAIPFEYGIVLQDQFDGNKIVIGVKFRDTDCFIKDHCVGEPIDIKGIAKIRLYKSSFKDQNYSANDYIEESVNIKHGILQLSKEELGHFITILDIKEDSYRAERQKSWEEATPIPLDMFESANRKKKRDMYTLNENLFESKLNKDLTKLRINDLDIEDITLLSVDEAEQIPEKYRKFSWYWWLRSPGYSHGDAADVDYDGSVYSHGSDVSIDRGCVRPALVISNRKSLNLPLYSEVELNNGTTWLVINDHMLLCNDKSFGKHRFDSESNDYEKSEIKQYIHEKAKEFCYFRRLERRRHWEEAIPISLDMFESIRGRDKLKESDCRSTHGCDLIDGRAEDVPESRERFKSNFDYTPKKYKNHLIYRGIDHISGLKDKYIYSVDIKPSFNPKHIHKTLADAKWCIDHGWYT